MLIVKSNGVNYIEGNFQWDDLPEPIESMEFKISDNKSIVMEGFDSYLRIKEMYKGVNVNIQGTSKVILFGRAKGQTGVVTIDIKKGTIENYIVPQGKEYGGKLQAEGHWKKGIPGKSIIKIKEV